MNVLVDTAVWSAVLRRKSPDAKAQAILVELVKYQRVRIIGPVRQELLSGIRDSAQFTRARSYLRSFPDDSLITDDYERAAESSISAVRAESRALIPIS